MALFQGGAGVIELGLEVAWMSGGSQLERISRGRGKCVAAVAGGQRRFYSGQNVQKLSSQTYLSKCNCSSG